MAFPLPLAGQHDSQMNRRQQRKAEYQRPVVIEFNGVIDGHNTNFLRNRLARAKSGGADLVIVQIDSPGGLVVESLLIAETLRDINWAYTVAWIPREAISGAALMSLGCDEMVLGPQARIGDAGPIQYDPLLEAYRYVPAKAKSVLVRQARDLATAKQKPPELAEAMVDENATVFRRKLSGESKPETEYRVIQLTDKEDDPLAAARDAGLDLNEWTLVTESGKGRILTVNGPTAVELGLADFVVEDMQSLLTQLNTRSTPTVYKYNFTDHVVALLTHPLATFLLIVIGLIALYVEFSAPGIGVGALISGLCAILFFWSRFFGGTAGWLEVILFLSGIVFLAMELFVLPGFGIAGFCGLVMLLTSFVMASQDFIVPANSGQWGQLAQTLLLVLSSVCVFVIGATFLSRRFGSIPVLGAIALKPPEEKSEKLVDKETGKPLPQTHPNVSAGDWGVAESLLRPAGRARINGVSIDVVSDGSYVTAGRQIRVVDISGNRVVVAEIEDSDETQWKRG